MPREFLCFKSSHISYIRYGTGPRLLLCFHGYGESAASFGFLEEALEKDFTVIAIDMPYHGDTEWDEGLFFDPCDLLALLHEIVDALPGLEDGWWMLGYSMGGRIALQLVELAPEKVRRLVLLAPDGLRVNPWYWIATQTGWGNRFFRLTMRKPGWFFFFLRTANGLRLVNPSVYKFTLNYIDDAEARRLLYTRWSVTRGFQPHLRKIGALVRERRAPVHLLYGRYDRIIRCERGKRFRHLCAPYCRLTILPAGHQLLQPKFIEVIVSALYLPII